MKNKVFFYKNPWGERYGPYLEISLYSKKGTELIRRGVVDTGADRFLLPYSLGLELGFTVSLEDMRKKPQTRGIGGVLNSLDSETQIILNHRHSGRVHKIITSVAWIIPTEEEFNFLNKLKEEINVLKVTVQLNPADGDLKKLYVDKQNKFAIANNLLEPDILIGREFMGNFSYLTFVHEKDPSKSYFEYELR